jgi:hypothetical protein
MPLMTTADLPASMRLDHQPVDRCDHGRIDCPDCDPAREPQPVG